MHLGGNRRWVSLFCIFGCETTVILIKISQIACSSLSKKIRFSKSSYFLKTKMKLRRRNIIPFFSSFEMVKITHREILTQQHRKIKYREIKYQYGTYQFSVT